MITLGSILRAGTTLAIYSSADFGPVKAVVIDLTEQFLWSGSFLTELCDVTVNIYSIFCLVSLL